MSAHSGAAPRSDQVGPIRLGASSGRHLIRGGRLPRDVARVHRIRDGGAKVQDAVCPRARSLRALHVASACRPMTWSLWLEDLSVERMTSEARSARSLLVV